MKLLYICLISLFATSAFAQLTFNDIYSIGNSINNPYNINKRSYFDIIDMLQTRGYTLTAFKVGTNDATGYVCAFDFQGQTEGATEKIRIVSADSRVGTRVFRYTIEVLTGSMTQYNSWLAIVRTHPDFVRNYTLESPQVSYYDARPGVGERQRISFARAIDYPSSPSGDDFKIQIPPIYTISFTRN